MPPLDPFNKLFRPDFQSPSVDLPQWQTFGEQQPTMNQSTGTMMDALKKRIGQGGGGGKGDMAIGAGGKAGSGAGGMNSL